MHNTASTNVWRLLKGVDSPWWPLHLPTSEQMQMNVVYRLTSPRSAVKNRPVSISQTLLLRNLLCNKKKVSDKALVLRLKIVERRNGLPRDHEYVHRRFRIYVPEGNTEIVLKNNVGWDFSVGYSLKQCLLAHNGQSELEW